MSDQKWLDGLKPGDRVARTNSMRRYEVVQLKSVPKNGRGFFVLIVLFPLPAVPEQP